MQPVCLHVSPTCMHGRNTSLHNPNPETAMHISNVKRSHYNNNNNNGTLTRLSMTQLYIISMVVFVMSALLCCAQSAPSSSSSSSSSSATTRSQCVPGACTTCTRTEIAQGIEGCALHSQRILTKCTVFDQETDRVLREYVEYTACNEAWLNPVVQPFVLFEVCIVVLMCHFI
jgi:hypothetical protein